MDLILKNALIPQGDRKVKTNILVDNEKIVGFSNHVGSFQADRVVDIGEKLVVPGCIDPHTHFMEPGFSHRDTFDAAGRSAAKGGLTMHIDMPCTTKPSVRSREEFYEKLNAVKDKAVIDFAFWGGMTGEDVREGKLHNIQPQIDEGVVAFKVYMMPSVPTFPPVSDAEMLEIFREIAPTGLAVGVHAENFDICTFLAKKLEQEGRLDPTAWSESRPVIAEKTAIQLIISFAEEVNGRVHVVHMTSKAGIELVREAKKRGVKVTAETCPQYLVLNGEEALTKWGTFAKIAPPLRTKEDNEAFWEALADGTVDFVGTDHAPYNIETEKKAPGSTIWNAFPGMPGVEQMVPILVSEGLNKGRLSLSRFVEVTSRNAAIHYGLYPKKGSMEIGADADFTVIDLDRKYTIDKDDTLTKAKYTPYHGMKLKGIPVMTIIRGRTVYDADNGGILSEPGYGQFVKRQSIQRLERVLKYETANMLGKPVEKEEKEKELV